MDNNPDKRMPAGRRPIKFDLTRDYSKVKSKGKISEIIDFHIHGKNRYMKINQPVSPKLLRNSWTKFKNPKLNKFEGSGEEYYKPKRYVFDVEEDDDTPPAPPPTSNNDPNNSKLSRHSKSSNDSVDERKVNKTVNMIENLLNEKEKEAPKKPKTTKKVKKPPKDDGGAAASESNEKEKFFRDHNIQVNKSTGDSENVDKIMEKPTKKNVTNQLLKNARETKTIGTQTPREVKKKECLLNIIVYIVDVYN